jgi:hypothetical protein
MLWWISRFSVGGPAVSRQTRLWQRARKMAFQEIHTVALRLGMSNEDDEPWLAHDGCSSLVSVRAEERTERMGRICESMH